MSRPVTQPCGTMAAYKRHRRKGETPCKLCKAENARWQREYQAAKRNA